MELWHLGIKVPQLHINNLILQLQHALLHEILHSFDNLQLNNEYLSITAEQEKEFEEEDGVIVDPGFTTPSEFFSQTEEPETT